MAKSDLTAERLKQLLYYSPETGIFTWRERPESDFATPVTHKKWNKKFSGKAAGHLRSDGYCDIRVDNHLHRAHRLAWLYMTKKWPKNLIDHIDRDPGNTKWNNLREATHSQNHQNQIIRKDAKVPYRGIELHSSGLWRASLMVKGKRIRLGYFKTPEEARDARLAGEKIHFTHASPPA